MTYDLRIGESYYIETFGKHFVGRVKSLSHATVTLEDAAWIADDGKYSTFLRLGSAEGMEVEPMGEVEIALAYISVKTLWPHNLFHKESNTERG